MTTSYKGLKKDMRNEKLKYLANTLSNIGVIGMGLALWQGGDWWAWVVGIIAIFTGYKLIGKVTQ